MDLQVPFLFTAEDFATARSAYTDQRALRTIISKYRPVFIAVPIGMQGFKTLIADDPQYHLLFFDDAEVLYGDASQEPGLVSRYAIKATDPYSLYAVLFPDKANSHEALQELLQLSEIYPGGGLVNGAIATLYQRQGRFRDALPYADAIIGTYPESHLGYKLKAELLARLGACGEALPYYKKAIDRSEDAMKKSIETEASQCERTRQTFGH